MNGAELPCGTCIKVEPSDPLHQLRKAEQVTKYGGHAPGSDSQATGPTQSRVAKVGTKEVSNMPEEDTGDGCHEVAGDDADDLDDFFASL